MSPALSGYAALSLTVLPCYHNSRALGAEYLRGQRVEGIPLALLGQLSRVDYRYIKRFLYKLFIEVVVFISLGQCSTRGCRVAGLSASSLMIREKKGGRKISEIYIPASTSTGLKYLFALLLAANVLPPREPDCCNYHVEEASKPTLRAAD
ncbi:hypothetical protein HBI22_247760 [Parastagonospora nodorum]|nr:hypothetical protein HBI28_243470 [Parastagonospora nodorum]KAH5617747.1 hypothetical protein HBI22_247760 [Parastagonospora nodorum]